MSRSEACKAENLRHWQSAWLDTLIILLSSFSILVDMVNGAAALAGAAVPLSVAFKGGLLLLLLVRISLESLRIAFALFAFLLCLWVSSYGVLLNTGRFDAFFLDFSVAIRVVFFLTFMSYLLCCKPPAEPVKQALIFLSLTMLFNLALGAAGLGYPTYSSGEGFGVKGFIFAGNELAVTLIALTYFILFGWLKTYSWFIQITGMLVVIATGFLVATKAAMLGVLVVSFMFLWVHRKGTLWVTAALIATTALVFLPPIIAFIQDAGLLERFIDIYRTRGFTSLVFSGRDQFLADMSHWVSQLPLYYGWLFGWGQGFIEMSLKSAVEIDLFDMLFWFGVPGVFAFIVFFVLLGSLLNQDKRFLQGTGGLMWLIIFGVSFFAGHVVYAGVPAIPLSLAFYYIHRVRSEKI